VAQKMVAIEAIPNSTHSWVEQGCGRQAWGFPACLLLLEKQS